MNRTRFLAAALALGGLLGAAEVRSAVVEHQRRLEEFQKKAVKEREALGLAKPGQRKALYARYPTPEVKLVKAPGGALPEVAVGSEATLTATGQFVPGSLAHVGCLGVEVLSQKVTERQAEVRVRVTEQALAGECHLEVFSPVSLAYSKQPAFRVVGSYQWELALNNGMKARMRTASQPGSHVITGTSEWTAKGGKALGSRPVSVERTSGGFRVRVERTQEEEAVAQQAVGAVQAEMGSADTQKLMNDIQQKMQKECMTLPPDKMASCIQKYSEQINALSQKMQTKAQAAQQKADSAGAACQMLELKVEGRKVTGQGMNCGASGTATVTGTVTVVK